MSFKGIHPSTVIHPSAQLGENVTVKPFTVIGEDVVIGDNSVIHSHVVIEDRTIIGTHAQIMTGAIIGGAPQDLSYKDEPTRVVMGDHVFVGDYATVHRASGEGGETIVGDHAMLMGYSHLAHNCKLGNHVILANRAQLAGYVQLDDYVFLGGGVLVHQFVHIGRMAFMGGMTATRQDVPPFAMINGWPPVLNGINAVGLKRRGISSQSRQRLKKAFFYFWFSGLAKPQAIEMIRQNIEPDPYVDELITFVENSKRGIAYKFAVDPSVLESNDAQETSSDQQLDTDLLGTSVEPTGVRMY